MTVSYREATENSRLTQVVTDAGATAWFQTWSGAVPATPIAAPAGSLLASCSMSATIGTVTGGVLTLNAIADDTTANGTGVPTFCRIATTETGTTTGIAQMSAAVGSGDVNFDASITAGATVSITASGTITHG